jgi:hypothetical protein
VLKPFGIHPEQIRFPSGASLKGYQRVQFENAWERYLPNVTRNTETNAVVIDEIDGF